MNRKEDLNGEKSSGSSEDSDKGSSEEDRESEKQCLDKMMEEDSDDGDDEFPNQPVMVGRQEEEELGAFEKWLQTSDGKKRNTREALKHRNVLSRENPTRR